MALALVWGPAAQVTVGIYSEQLNSPFRFYPVHESREGRGSLREAFPFLGPAHHGLGFWKHDRARTLQPGG